MDYATVRWVKALAAIGAAIAVLIALPGGAIATSLPAKITTNMTLTAAASPYTGGAITVETGVTVTIEPGVATEVNSWTVYGTLNAEGSASNPILLPKTFFKSGSGGVIEHGEINHAGSAGYGAIEIENASPTISHSTILASNGYGISVNGGAPDIGHNEILSSTSVGVCYCEEGTPNEVNFHDNVLEHNGGSAAIYVEGSSGVIGNSLAGNTIRENESLQAIHYNGGSGKVSVPPDVANNVVTGNKSNSVQISGTLKESGTWDGVAVTIGSGTFTVAKGVTLNLKPGMTIEGAEVKVEGTLNAEGSEFDTVLFTASSERGAIVLGPNSGASVLDYIEVVHGPGASRGAIEIEGASPTISHSTIRNSNGYGIRVASGAPSIEWNRFRTNVHGLIYEGSGKLSAPNNDWGCASGPAPAGCGDDVNSKVNWKPAAILPELPRHCSGGALPASDPDCLLAKYEPQLKYDSAEMYRADSAAEITDNWGDEPSGLWGESEVGPYGNELLDDKEALAQSNPGIGGEFPLTLSALRVTYPNATGADEDDWLVERGEAYAEDAQALEAQGYLDNVYGKTFTDGSGQLWLQYWYFYYYNSLEILGVGKHEGDWEMVEIGLDEEEKPEVVVLSQHDGGARCEIEEMDQTETGAPVVYIGFGSHANYPEAGSYSLPPIGTWPFEVIPGSDTTNGEGEASTPPLTIIDEAPKWIAWPGHWGNSRGSSQSPVGPAFHDSWKAPDTYAEEAHGCRSNQIEFPMASRSVTAPSPDINSATLLNGRPRVAYQVPGGRDAEWPRLVLSVDDPNDGLPPLTKVIRRVDAEGKATLPFEIDAHSGVVVLASVAYKNGRRSPTVRHVLRP